MPLVWNAGKRLRIALLVFPVGRVIRELVDHLLVEFFLSLLDLRTSLSTDAYLDHLFGLGRISLLRVGLIGGRSI